MGISRRAWPFWHTPYPVSEAVSGGGAEKADQLVRLRLGIVAGVVALPPPQIRRLPRPWWQRDAQPEPCPVGGAQRDVIGEGERDHRLVGGVQLQHVLDVVSMLELVGQSMRAHHADDGAPV